MITIKEIITVTRGDPMFKAYERQLMSGWKREDCTTSSTWIRVQTIGEAEHEKQKKQSIPKKVEESFWEGKGWYE